MAAELSALHADTWLIVPLYNEAQVIAEVVRDARRVFPNVVCVDDGSRDDSIEQALAGGATVIRHPINLGQGAALQTGIAFALAQAGAEYFVTFDADGQHRVDDAAAMVDRVRGESLDIVIGSRFLDKRTQLGALKRAVLRMAVFFERLTTRVKLTDAHNGLRALNRTAATSIVIKQNRMAHASEIVAQVGRLQLRYAEQPVQIIYTDYSRAKGQSLWNSVNILSELFIR